MPDYDSKMLSGIKSKNNLLSIESSNPSISVGLGLK